MQKSRTFVELALRTKNKSAENRFKFQANTDFALVSSLDMYLGSITRGGGGGGGGGA